jgi:hypothetical protein
VFQTSESLGFLALKGDGCRQDKVSEFARMANQTSASLDYPCNQPPIGDAAFSNQMLRLYNYIYAIREAIIPDVRPERPSDYDNADVRLKVGPAATLTRHIYLLMLADEQLVLNNLCQ